MVRSRSIRLWLSAVVLVVSGCVALAPQTPAARPVDTHTITLSQDLRPAQSFWRVEVRKRYPAEPLLLVVGHGADFMGEWWVVPDAAPPHRVRELVESVREHHEQVRLILVICNPGGYELDEPGVTYADRNVWVVPTVYVSPFIDVRRTFLYGSSAGTIHDFHENPW